MREKTVTLQWLVRPDWHEWLMWAFERKRTLEEAEITLLK